MGIVACREVTQNGNARGSISAVVKSEAGKV